jgi:hypothetical protein
MCSIDDNDLLPPSFDMENATYGNKRSPLREIELNFQSSQTHTVVPRWFIERGSARSVTKLTLGSKSPAIFEPAWALVQQCARTLEQLIISVPPRWVADAEEDIALTPIYASSLTSFCIEDLRDTSLRSVVRIVGCIGFHAPLLRGLVIKAKLKETDEVQCDELSWHLLDSVIESNTQPALQSIALSVRRHF